MLHDVKDKRRSQAVENIREYSETMSIEAGSPARLLLQADVFSMKRTLKYSRRTITERRQEKMSNEI